MARTLRNEDTPEGRAIWAAVDKAASRAPKWMKERIESLELNLPGAIKPREVGGMADLATKAQIDWICKLVDMAGMQLEFDDYVFEMTDGRTRHVENCTKREASKIIDDLKEVVGLS